MRYLFTLVAAALLGSASPALAQQASPTPIPSENPLASPAAQSSPVPAGETARIRQRVQAEFAAWQSGKVNRTGYSAQAAAAFTDATVANISTQLRTLGAPQQFTFQSATMERGDTVVVYRVACAKANVRMLLALNGDDKVDGLYFRPAGP